MNDAVIRLDDVVFQYEDNDTPTVNHITLDVARGEFVAVLGRNGCGKSTLARLLNALLIPTSGTVTVDGIRSSAEEAYAVRERCGMVFQNPDNQIVSTVVEEDCAFGLENMGVPTEQIRPRVEEALREVGMLDRKLASPGMLSGGQKQRVAIAGVLAMRPKIIVFDESTAMLDPVGRRDVLGIAQRINREDGVTVIWITHYMEEAVHADRVLVMDGGRIALQGTPRDVFSHTDDVVRLGLDVPQMMKLAAYLRDNGVENLPQNILTVAEMAEKLCDGSCTVKPADAHHSESSAAQAKEAQGKTCIEIKQLTHIYMPGSPFESRALDNVSLEIRAGEFIGIIGHTGSGKSTMIGYLDALERAKPGHVFVDGTDLGESGVNLTQIRRKVGLVFQYPEYQLFEETVEADIGFGPRNLGLPEEEIPKSVRHAMQMVGLAERKAKASPFALSGGQKRRVAIAGVLAMNPSILVLDEPAAGLDPDGRRSMLEMIRDIHESGVTVIMVSHSMDDVGKYCDRLFVLNHGRIALRGTPREIFMHADELRGMGLDVPEYAALATLLRDRGFDIDPAAYSKGEVGDAIIKNLNKGGMGK